MITALMILHVFVCILLIVVVILQFGKGAEVGAVMGSSSSQAIFTSSQSGNFFTKATTVLAITFMVNSVALSILKSKAAKKSVLDNEAPVAVPLNSDGLQNKAIDPAKTTSESETQVPAKEAPKKAQ